MRKKSIFLALFSLIILLFVQATPVFAEEEENQEVFRVGMEAAYAPFNWTQTTDANGAVPKSGVNGAFVGGYDVEMARRIADGLGKELEVVAIQWDGLVPALQSGKIDAIIAGMTPTEERRQQIAFTDAYYESHLVIVVQREGKFADATSLADLEGARITAQLNTFHYNLIDQIPGVDKQQAQQNFSAMRVALASGVIDGYVSEYPEGVTATKVNPNLKMLEFSDEDGFQTTAEEVQVAIGMRQNDPLLPAINEILATIPQEERDQIMDEAISNQPSAVAAEDTGLVYTFKQILDQFGPLFLRGAGTTVFIAIFSTIAGTMLGLLVGVFRSLPKSEHLVSRWLQKLMDVLLTIYIEVFRGTPMMVQAMVIFYGIAMLFQVDLNRTMAALFIVSINTGAYMSEIVRGGIFAVDKGQFEAAQAIGMTHRQTMQRVVLPQVVRNILPAIGNETVINIKDTAVLSVISVGDLFFQGTAAAGTNLLFFQTFTIIGVMYLILTVSATQLLRFLERKMDGPTEYARVDTSTTTEE